MRGLLSGITLAGTTRELAGAGTDGILFALEAQGLNLDGIELVVLSACDTAQGSLDYSEGVFGPARALRKADAGNVLVTLWKLNGRSFPKATWSPEFAICPVRRLKHALHSRPFLMQQSLDPSAEVVCN